MKNLLFYFMCLVPMVTMGQVEPTIINGTAFNSVFQNMVGGNFQGTVNGILILKSNHGKTLLDFQGSKAELEIETDSFEVYDVSTKIYKGLTTSGNTKIQYRTYGSANAIRINIFDDWYQLSYIDGSCYAVIDGLEYHYEIEKSAEYLVLVVTKELILNNWQHIIQTEHTTNPNNIQDLKPKKKEIMVMPNSTIVFAIQKG